jgi:hypothetical protein
MNALENRETGDGDKDLRVENVLSIVALNPLYNPEKPSFSNIRIRTAVIERLVLSVPFGRAWIRVFALDSSLSLKFW